MPGIISSIEKDSIAEELGWRPGDEVVSIDGHVLHDVIDYRFYSAQECLDALIQRGDQQAHFEIEKDYDLPLGVEFEEPLFDGVRTCGAHCIFCFVEQLPKGLRKPLYLKDDDYRLSFLDGNYVTLGNVTDEDLVRIVTQRLSPLYISVHTTDPELREKMLGRSAPDILAQMDRLAEGRITLHTQIVLCPGVNDGSHLDRTVSDLASRHPAVASIAVVPVGLTAHRRNKTPIDAFAAQDAEAILDQITQWHRRFLREKGTRLVWAADEFYLSAHRPVPKAAAYEGFPQIENGVGLVRKFKDSAYRANRILPRLLPRPLRVSVVTGKSAEPVLRQWIKSIPTKNLEILLHPVRNKLFGESVTVTGLLAGRDVIEQLRGKDLGEALVIPSVALRDGVFLDDVTLEDVRAALGVSVLVVDPAPYRLAVLLCSLAA